MTAANKKRGLTVRHRARVPGSPLKGARFTSPYIRSSGFGGGPVRTLLIIELSSLRASSGPNVSGSISASLADATNVSTTLRAFLVARGFSVCMTTELTLIGLNAPGTNLGRDLRCGLIPSSPSHSIVATRNNSRHGAPIEHALPNEDQAHLPPSLKELRLTSGQAFDSSGVCVLSQSANAACISSFQFGPAALKVSTTSASSHSSTHSPDTDLSGMDVIRSDEFAGHTFTSLGVCVLSQSASTAFMRVCQPGPEALNCSSTSESKRTLTCSLVVAAFGRPRLGLSISFAWALPNNPASTSLAGLALAKSLADHSGFVVSTISGLSFLVIAFDLPFVGFTETDDVYRITPRGEHHDMQSIPYESHRLIPALAVIKPVVFQDQGRGPIEVAHQGEWESAFFNVACVFGWVISYLHGFIVPTINTFDNSPRFPTIAKSAHSRYGLPVAANSATGRRGPTSKRRSSAQDPIASAFFVPAMSFYGGCAWDTFGYAGFLLPRSANPRTAATLIRFAANGGSSTAKGASPMQVHTPALNPSRNSQTLAIIGAELIAYRVNRKPEQRARLLGLVQMADTLGALNATDRATLTALECIGGAQ